MANIYTLEQEVALGRRIQQGDLLARNQLIEANLDVVKHHLRRYAGRGVDDEDLMQEGRMGLIRASEDYNPEMNVRFATHAKPRVLDCMRMSVAFHSHPIRLAHHATKKFSHVTKFKQKYFQQHGFEPTEEEIRKALELEARDLQTVTACKPIIGATSLSNEPDPVDQFSCEEDFDNEDFVRLRTKMKDLPYHQKEVLQRYFGMHHGNPESLEDISCRLGCNMETAARLKAIAIDHLKHILEQGGSSA